MITTVIFDMDGLLLDTEPLWGESMRSAAARHNIPIAEGRFKDTTGLRIYEVLDHWAIHFPWHGSSPKAIADEILEDIIASGKRSGMVMAGVIDALEQLQANGFKIGLASSSPLVMIDALIDHFEMRSYFHQVSSADAVEVGKPHPGVFLHCASALGSKVNECLVLEDSVNGMIAAKAARMKCIVVPDPNHFEDPRFVLADARLRSLRDFSLSLVKNMA